MLFFLPSFFFCFSVYHRAQQYQNIFLFIAINTLILLLFILSVYRLKYGLFLLIFLIPLLSSVTTVLAVRNTNIIIFLFSAVFMGFLINRFTETGENYFKKALNKKGILYFNPGLNIWFDRDLALPVLFLMLIVTISAVVTIYRYANFFPFLSTKYHDLLVNILGDRSTDSIFWTINFFFNALIGFSFFFVIFNVIKKKKDIIIATVVIIISNVLVSVFGLYQYYVNPNLGTFQYWVDANRINATFTDPNSLGIYIVIMFPLYFGLFIFLKRWWQKTLVFIGFILFFITGIMSGSRNAFIGIFITFLVFIIIAIVHFAELFLQR